MPATTDELVRLAHLHGVQTGYRDITGSWREAGPDAVRAVLRALGVDAHDPDAVTEAARRRMDELDRRVLGRLTPVEIGVAGRPPEIALRLPPEAAEGEIRCELVLEDGFEMEWRTLPEPVEAADTARRIGATMRLPRTLPVGYHDLSFHVGDEEVTTRLLAAPPTTWRPDDEGAEREWGVFMPLYALRSERSWGTGDLGDLERLLRWVDDQGGDIVGTLPMLAADARTTTGAPVYNPISRLFWNELYLDVERAPELQRSPTARRLLESSDFQRRIHDLRTRDDVDWRGSLEAKREVLAAMARDVLSDGMPDGLRAFVEKRPEAESYARFRATWDARQEPWGSWPERLRRPPLEPTEGHEDDVRYHLFAQWLADREMRELRDRRGDDGAGLYLDLPLGCHPDGFDVWRYQELFAEGVAVGAPPDDFFTKGQNWGFPALRPDRMQEHGLDYTIATLRHHMRFSSRLRLDHVMGLHRLFWVPGGMDASDGVYVQYPSDALHAALRIESHRHHTVVVGEDLGTVPDEVRHALARDRIDRMYVAQIEARPKEQPTLPPPPSQAVYSLNTHDTATFAGFWAGSDIDVRLELELITPEEADALRAERSELRVAWTRFLVDEGEAPPDLDADDAAGVLEATLRAAARTSASLLLVNLEDLWLEPLPQNVPGTGPERPNFRRKARRTLEHIVTDDDIRKTLRELNRLRAGDTARSERRTAP